MSLYTIRKGQHYSAGPMSFFFRFISGWHRGQVSKVEATFTDSCLAASSDPLDEEDFKKDRHKLFGVSEEFDHHQNSARFAWVEADGKIALFTYVYRNGVRQDMKQVASVPVDKPHIYKIERKRSTWLFTVEDSGGRILGAQEVVANRRNKYYYRKLYPYYGGNFPAPVNTYIYLNW